MSLFVQVSVASFVLFFMDTYIPETGIQPNGKIPSQYANFYLGRRNLDESSAINSDEFSVAVFSVVFLKGASQKNGGLCDQVIIEDTMESSDPILRAEWVDMCRLDQGRIYPVTAKE